MRPRAVDLATLLWLALPGLCQAAEQDAAAKACHQKDKTTDIVQCLDGLTAQWDKRLNTAYQAALKASDSKIRHDALTRTERAWLAFRSENCGWYDAQDGTIRLIAAADCMFDMTRARALELEEALRP